MMEKYGIDMDAVRRLVEAGIKKEEAMEKVASLPKEQIEQLLRDLPRRTGRRDTNGET